MSSKKVQLEKKNKVATDNFYFLLSFQGSNESISIGFESGGIKILKPQPFSSSKIGFKEKCISVLRLLFRLLSVVMDVEIMRFFFFLWSPFKTVFLVLSVQKFKGDLS